MTDHDTIPQSSAESYRYAFTDAFEYHEELTENQDEVYEDEVAGEMPVDVTLQTVIASYDEVTVWLLNEFGPVQAFYDESGEWGEPGDVTEVASEVAERLNE